MIGQTAQRIRGLIGGAMLAPAPRPTPQSASISNLSATPLCTPGPDRDQTPKRRAARRSPRLMRVWLDALEPRPETRPTVHQHARRLLDWLRDDPRIAGSLVLAADLQRIYPKLCRLKEWEPYPWNTLARELRSLTGSKKRQSQATSCVPCPWVCQTAKLGSPDMRQRRSRQLASERG